MVVPQSITLLLLAILPALGWIVVYRYLDSREPEPLAPTSEALIFGIFSTFPVFLMQFLFTTFPHWSLSTWLQGKVSTPALFSLFFLLFVAVIEEFVKGVALIWLIKKQEKNFNQIVDGIVYGALVGVGFAIAENIYYFSKAVEVFQYNPNFWAIFTIRSFGTMLAHTIFTGFFGFYFAKSYFSPLIDEASKQEKIWHHLKRNFRQAIRLHATFFHLMPKEEHDQCVFNRNVMILEGYVIAVFLHLLYNALIKIELFDKSWTFLIIPLVFVAAWWIWSRFFMKLYTRVIEYIQIRKDLYHFRIH